MLKFQYLKILIFFICVFLVTSILHVLVIIFNPDTIMFTGNHPIECGSHSLNFGQSKYDVIFYRVAIIFVIFEAEIFILLPWIFFYDLYIWSCGIVIIIFLFILILCLYFEYSQKVFFYK